MTDREKIISIIEQNKYCDVNTTANCRECRYNKELANYKDMGCSSLKTADALIEAGFISLKTSSEWAREACDILRNIKDDEIKCICEERDDIARRAEVAERALVIMAERVLEYAQKAKVTAMTSDGLFSCDKNAQLALLVNDALLKAEQEMTEEK